MPIFPSKLLPLDILTIVPQTNWNENDGTGDPWIGNPYRWTLTANVSAQTHSCHLTPTPFLYDGNDIFVGMWLADILSGLSVKIVTINSQNANQINCIVEDVDRFNTFSDPSQNGIGIGNTGTGFCFVLGEDGLPVLGNMTSSASILNQNPAWQEDLVGRFRSRNFTKDYINVLQPSHGLQPDDLIRLNGSGNFVKAQATSLLAANVIGKVVDVGIPGINYFSYKPFGDIRSTSTVLPGTPGNLLYLNPTTPGTFTLSKPSIWSKSVAIKMSDTKAMFFASNFDAITSAGYTNNAYQVNTIAERDALIGVNIGDQVRVNNVGNNRWGLFIYSTGNVWSLISTQEAVATDAQTINLIVNYNSTSPTQIVQVLSGTKIIEATIRVITPFNGTTPTITIGGTSSNDSVMAINHSDLKTIGFYEKSSEFVYPVDSIVNYYLNTSGSTAGSLELTLTYVR
jgi:hypothetical protein